MKEDYTDLIQQVSQVVFEAISEREENLATEVQELDGQLAKLLRLVGREVRVGLARPVEKRDSRTFIARRGKYPELVPQLHSRLD